MIRDPSDGTVRETGDVNLAGEMRTAGIKMNPDNDLILASTSGLPLESQKPEQQAKLEKSRAWLRNRKQGLVQSRAEIAETECDHLTTEKPDAMR